MDTHKQVSESRQTGYKRKDILFYVFLGILKTVEEKLISLSYFSIVSPLHMNEFHSFFFLSSLLSIIALLWCVSFCFITK